MENMTQKEMLEKIAELDYSQNQLKDLNSAMRHWLDVADDDMAVLRAENVALRKQVKVMEKLISEAQQDDLEPNRFNLTDDLDVKRSQEKKIQKLEEESIMMKEQNKKLTTELGSIQQEKEEDKMSLDKFKAELKILELEMEEAQVELQHREESINQKNLQLQHLEETVEEYSRIIKDLRQTNQELRMQLEDRQDEALLSSLNDMKEETEGSPGPPMSFLDEIKLLASSDELRLNISDSKSLRNVETEVDELLIHQSLTVDLQTKRWTGMLTAAFQRVGLFMMCILSVLFVVFVAVGVSCDLLSINTFWTGAHVILQPRCSVHYGDLPPI